MASNVVAIAGGYSHSAFVKTDMTLWLTGGNGNGQLGNGTSVNTNQPVAVATNVVGVAAGYYHTLFARGDATLWSMGYNYSGQLGNGNNLQQTSPVQVPGVAAASLGPISLAIHSLAVAANPTQVAPLSDQSVMIGQPFTFTLTVTNGTGPFTYQWQLNGTNIARATNSSYTIATTALANAGTYSVVVSGMVGTAGSSAALTVLIPLQNFRVSALNGTNGIRLLAQLAGAASYPYILQAATNLTPPVNWQPVITNAADTNGNWQFLDTNLNAGQKFYRALGQ